MKHKSLPALYRDPAKLAHRHATVAGVKGSVCPRCYLQVAEGSASERQACRTCGNRLILGTVTQPKKEPS